MTERQRQHLCEVLAKLKLKINQYRKTNRALGEQNTKATLIDPLLAAIGWDVENVDEVHREYRRYSNTDPVDYALSPSGTPRLLIEAKAFDKNIDVRRDASQVVSYAATAGVEWCVLTNGDEYLLYNSQAEGDVERKLFRRVAISDAGSEHLLLDTLDLLSKDMHQEKRLAVLWEHHYVDRKVKAGIEKSWSGAHHSLIRLLRTHAEGLTPSQIKASLERGRLVVEFPLESVQAVTPRSSSRGVQSHRRRSERGAAGLPVQSLLEAHLLLELMNRGGKLEMRTQFDELAHALAKTLALTPKQLEIRTRDGRMTLWKNRIQWARQALVNKGDVDKSERGVWKLTPQGRARAEHEGRRGLSLVDPA